MRAAIGVLIVGGILAADLAASGVALPRAMADGWSRYVAAVEARRRAEARTSGRFFVMDQGANHDAGRRQVLSGRLLVEKVDGPAPRGSEIEVDGAMVHHWRGAVLLEGLSLDVLLARLQSDGPPPGPDVLRSAVLERGPSRMKVYLRLQRTKVVTAVYNTEHLVTFTRLDPRRAESRSVATKIAELDQPGTRAERELTFSNDRGFLWALHAFWRYEQVAGGVIAECESISLSRRVPFGLGLVAGPIISSTARESMERTLEALRDMAG